MLFTKTRTLRNKVEKFQDFVNFAYFILQLDPAVKGHASIQEGCQSKSLINSFFDVLHIQEHQDLLLFTVILVSGR